jgi:hypothetical protein
LHCAEHKYFPKHQPMWSICLMHTVHAHPKKTPQNANDSSRPGPSAMECDNERSVLHRSGARLSHRFPNGSSWLWREIKRIVCFERRRMCTGNRIHPHSLAPYLQCSAWRQELKAKLSLSLSLCRVWLPVGRPGSVVVACLCSMPGSR